MPRCDPLAGGKCESISRRAGRRAGADRAGGGRDFRIADIENFNQLTGWAGEATTPPSP